MKNMVSQRLQNKKALVTGGGVGIGESIALAFAREGADVAIASRNTANLERVAAKIREMGRQCLPITVDIADEDQVIAMVNETITEFGRIDVLVNNSGIPGQFLDVSNMDLADWNLVLAVNITGTMLCSREALKGYAAPEVGEHHQHFFDGREKGDPQAKLLRHIQVGHARVHADFGPRGRARQYPGQLHLSRRHRGRPHREGD